MKSDSTERCQKLDRLSQLSWADWSAGNSSGEPPRASGNCDRDRRMKRIFSTFSIIDEFTSREALLCELTSACPLARKWLRPNAVSSTRSRILPACKLKMMDLGCGLNCFYLVNWHICWFLDYSPLPISIFRLVEWYRTHWQQHSCSSLRTEKYWSRSLHVKR